jgi:hypothetical protein
MTTDFEGGPFKKEEEKKKRDRQLEWEFCSF